MYRVLFTFLLATFMLSCSDRKAQIPLKGTGVTGSLVAEGIIYDVIILPQSGDDEWEVEKTEGYKGSQMIDRIFEAIYDGSVEVYDYHSGELLTRGDIRKMEQQEGFGRNNIGKIQFTENWYFNPANLQIEKEIISIVPGYESRSSDGMFIGYRAGFRLDLKKVSDPE